MVFSLRWQKELLLIQRSLKLSIPAFGNHNDRLKKFEECHTPTRMDDVDYLVEDNAMDDFCLSSEMDGTCGRTT